MKPNESVPDGNVHVMPSYGREHFESKECWCEPDLIEDYRDDGGVELWLHREIQ